MTTEHPYWIDSDGMVWYPQDMSTKHLFFTVRMLWNHLCPPEMRFEPYKEYPSLYYGLREPTNAKRLRALLPVMLRELERRPDMEPYFSATLYRMKLHFLNGHFNLKALEQQP